MLHVGPIGSQLECHSVHTSCQLTDPVLELLFLFVDHQNSKHDNKGQQWTPKQLERGLR